MGPADAIRDLAAPTLAAVGLDLWDVEVVRDVVRVFVDRDGGVDLDALTEANAVLSPLLDEHPEVTPEGGYELEVSSPGIERTLRTVDHLRRNVGQLVNVKTTVPVAGSRRWQGVLVAVDDDGLTVEPTEPAGAPAVVVAHRDVSRTRTVLVWGPSPKPKPGTASPRKPGAKRTPIPGAVGAVPASTTTSEDARP